MAPTLPVDNGRRSRILTLKQRERCSALPGPTCRSVGFVARLPVVSRAPLSRTCPGFSEQFRSYLRRTNYGAGISFRHRSICSGAHMSSQIVLPPGFVDEIRSALLSRSSVLASEIGVLIQEVAKRHGISVLLRELGGAHLFVDTHLADLFVRDSSPDSFGPRLRFIARAALAPAPSIAVDGRAASSDSASVSTLEPDGKWWPADGRDRSFWDKFNNPLRSARFALTSEGALYWTESATDPPIGAQQIRPMTSEDYRQMAQLFADNIKDAVAQQRMLQVLSESPDRSFPTEWFRLVGVLGQRPAWEATRITQVVNCFRQRLIQAGANPTTADLYAAELSKSKRASKQRGAPPQPLASYILESGGAAINLRRFLVDLAKTLSDDEIRQLRVPLGKVIDLLGVSHSKPH